MNLFMRSVSILASAAIVSLAPSFAFSGVPAPANDNNTLTPGAVAVWENTRASCAAFDKCEAGTKPPGITDCGTKPQICEAANDNNPGGGAGGPTPPQQGGGDPQQQGSEEQPQQAAGSGGGNCADTSPDPENKSANSPNLKNAPKGEKFKPGEGKKETCEQIKSSFDQRAKQASQQGSAQGLTTAYSSLERDLQEYLKNRESCLTDQAKANTQCMEGNSPDTANASDGVSDVLGQVGQNASDTCGKFSKAMDIAKAGLGAFSANCGAAQSGCSSSCSKANTGLKALVQKAEKDAGGGAKCADPNNQTCQQLLQQYNAALQEGIQAAQQEMDSQDPEAVAGKQKTCDGEYKGNMGNALQGIMGMLAGLQQGAKCEKETDGTAEQKGTLADKCILPENAALPECICKANPRTVGCAGAYDSLSANANGQFGGGVNDKANVNPTDNVGSLDNGLGNMEQSARDPSSDGAGAPAGGGGAGVGSSSVGSGAGGAAAEGEYGKGLNANILGGSGGGGGTGGAWGAGGAGDKYRQYLPGGAKDPAKAIAGQQAWTKEVTGQGGKSNFEKIKDRYRDNKNSLINK